MFNNVKVWFYKSTLGLMPLDNCITGQYQNSVAGVWRKLGCVILFKYKYFWHTKLSCVNV